jgi:hypothetical protein
MAAQKEAERYGSGILLAAFILLAVARSQEPLGVRLSSLLRLDAQRIDEAIAAELDGKAWPVQDRPLYLVHLAMTAAAGSTPGVGRVPTARFLSALLELDESMLSRVVSRLNRSKAEMIAALR